MSLRDEASEVESSNKSKTSQLNDAEELNERDKKRTSKKQRNLYDVSKCLRF